MPRGRRKSSSDKSHQPTGHSPKATARHLTRSTPAIKNELYEEIPAFDDTELDDMFKSTDEAVATVQKVSRVVELVEKDLSLEDLLVRDRVELTISGEVVYISSSKIGIRTKIGLLHLDREQVARVLSRKPAENWLDQKLL